MSELNPVIRGWCSYYAAGVSTATFSRLRHVLFRMPFAWARRRHPKKGKGWVAGKYWHAGDDRKWNFGPAGTEYTLN